MELINKFLITCLFVIVISVLSFMFIVFVWSIYYRIFHKIKKIKGEYKYVGFGSKFKRLFVDFPRQFAFDRLTRNPDEFREFGFNMICGKQGTGKTITLVYLLLRYKKMYPKLRISTNMSYKYEDSPLRNWQDLVYNHNDIYGQIDVIDEVQNWFNCNQSKDFPPQMLSEITQQRKQRKMILATSQVFQRVAKPIRENTYMLYEPKTFFGCLTFVKKYDVTCSLDGQIDNKNSKGIFFFVHNKKIRNAFDTYKKIVDMSKDGFVERTSQFKLEEAENNIEIESKKKIKIKNLE